MTMASGSKARASTAGHEPDLGAMAREAVITFLRETATATAGRPVAATTQTQVAAAGVATLERIEALAAKVDADIGAALAAQADLQAGAGAAAAEAVSAAQSSWNAAAAAAESDRQAKISLRKVARYVAITSVMLIIAIVLVVLTASSAR